MRRLSLLLLLAAGCTSGLDLKEGRNYPCVPDAGTSQCAEGFICGLEGRCHAENAPGPWQCDSDRYCAPSQGWYCEPVSGKCVDAADDELAAPRPIVSERVSPALPTPEHVAISSYLDYSALTDPDLIPLEVSAETYTDYTRHWVIAAKQKVTSVIAVDGEDQTQLPWIRQDAPEPQGGVTDLAAHGVHVYVANPGGVWTRQVRAHPEAWQKLDLPNLVPTRLIDLQPLISGTPEILFILGGSSYAWINLETGTLSGVKPMPNGAHVIDIASAQPDTWAGSEEIFALTDQGVFVTERDDTGFLGESGGALAWVPIAVAGFGNTNCAGTVPGEPLMLRADTANSNLRLRILYRENGGDPSNPTVLNAEAPPPTGAITTCENLTFTQTMKGTACPTGQKFSSSASYLAYGDFESFCTNAAGTHPLNLKPTSGVPHYLSEEGNVCMGPLDMPVFASSQPDENAWADPTGRLWIGGYSAMALTEFPHGPLHVVAGGGTARLYAESVQTACYEDQNGDYVVLNDAYAEEPGVGLTRIRVPNGTSANGLCGSLENSPRFVISDRPKLDADTNWLPEFPAIPVIQVTTIEDAYSGVYNTESGILEGTNTYTPWAQLESVQGIPAHPCGPDSPLSITGTTFRLPDASFEVMVAAGDSFYVGPLAKKADGGSPASLVPRHVLSPRINIDQVVSATPNADRGEIAAGYALASARVFRYSAQSAIRWSSVEYELPSGEPIAVWSSGANGRVGFADGKVVALPSRLVISDTLPAPVSSYGSMCGMGYAISGGALYRLEAQDGSHIGKWNKVDIDWGVPPTVSPASVTPSRLHSVPGALYVISEQGTIAKLTGDCP